MFVSIGIIFNADLFSSSGLGGFILIGIPFVVGISTGVVYLISRIFIKEYNWVFTLISIIYNLYFSLEYYFK